MPRRITDLPEPPESSYDRIMKRALGVPMFPYRIPLRELLLGVMHDHENPDSVAYEGCDKEPCMWCVSAKSHLEEMAE